jgi:hypothetical protein
VEAKPKEKKRGLFGFGAKKKKKEEPKEPAIKEKEAEFGAIEIRKIRLGHTTPDLMEVEDGLKEDELVVVEVQEEFKDKARVEIAEVQEGLL